MIHNARVTIIERNPDCSLWKWRSVVQGSYDLGSAHRFVATENMVELSPERVGIGHTMICHDTQTLSQSPFHQP